MTSTITALPRSLACRAHLPGTPAFDAARAGFDLAAIPNPDLAVSVASEDDVVAAVRYAAAQGSPISVRATGHGTVPAADRGLLIDTRALSAATVDPLHRTATIGAGVKWTRVLEACAPFGIAPLCGSSPDVGAVSYSLGGGLGPLGRAHGWSADHLRRLRLVTPTGELLEVDADREPELFWALRGGGGNFGVVTEMEIDLVPAADLYGGGLYLPGEAAPELLATFRRVTTAAPDELSLSVAFLTFPTLDAVPALLRGRFVAHLRVSYLGRRDDAEALIAPLRAVATPIVDAVRTLPIAEMGSIHADPTRPQPVSCGSAVLPEWDDAVTDVLLGEIGPTIPHMLEVRHLGGALARPAAVANAVGQRDARYNVFTSAYPGPRFATAADLQTAFYQRLSAWSGDRALYNFVARPDGGPIDARLCYAEPILRRLVALKQVWDPQNLLRYTAALRM
jgi:FAD binding domain